MKFKELLDACDDIGNHDLIQLYTHCFIDSTGHVSVDNYLTQWLYLCKYKAALFYNAAFFLVD